MTSKDYLRQYRCAERRLFDLDEQKHILWVKMEKVTGLYAEPIGHTRSTNTLPTLMAEYIAREHAQAVERQQCASIMSEVRHTICAVADKRLRTLLEYRYLDGFDWEQVANLMQFSEEYVKRDLHDAAMQKINPLLPTSSPL
ncbi:MAG: hypothetical protein FWE40_05405 [Oscillospiraceae bacterium]|nr:hypothetical protein [Oscillospiraceae bacterium]